MIQNLDELQSARMVYRAGEKFNPPALTNFLGSLQAATCVGAIQHLTFPPLSLGDATIGAITVNDTSVAASGLPITFTWRPDRIIRSVEVGLLELRSTTVMGVNRQSVTIKLSVSNNSEDSEDINLRFQTGGGVMTSESGWHTPYSPKEGPAISVTPWEGAPPPETLVENVRTPGQHNDCVAYESRLSRAFCLQGCSTKPKSIDRSWLNFSFSLSPGEKKSLFFFVGVGDSMSVVQDMFDAWKLAPSDALSAAEADWLAELTAAFTPGNDRYSGHLPTLSTANRDLRRIYLTSIIGVIYHKRLSPRSAYGRTYVTLMPRYWVTTSFVNDWSMSAYLLAMLDPACLRSHIEMWLGRDIYSHFGTEYVSGGNSGNWYSCNDFAMLRLISAYVRVTGDESLFDANIDGRTVFEHCREMVFHYKALDTGSGLADYGDRNSLLEAVGSYTNEVASLNATNVWNLREFAAICEQRGSSQSADDLYREAETILPELFKLYVPAGGYWNVRKADGELVPVRHAWDFVHTMNFVGDDLTDDMKETMFEFFAKELQTPSWMAALSALDEDVHFSLRPDHEWNGSWPGWVALAACALVRHDHSEMLAGWLPGLAKTANQGPYSQAHFVERYAKTIDGGARKAPTEWPYITDWATICVGGFFELVVLQLFGIEFGYASISAAPKLKHIDENAQLENVPFRGVNYSLSAIGLDA